MKPPVPPQPGPGLYPGVPSRVYHREWTHAENKSRLIHLLDCPAKYRYHADHPNEAEASPAMVLGSAVHALAYEPEAFERDFVLAPDLNLRTKDGRAQAAAFALDHPDRTLIGAEAAEEARAIAAAVRADPEAAATLAGAKFETSILWRDDETGILCKARPDGWCRNLITDLKTTRDLDGFARDADRLGYFFQAALYARGAGAVTGENITFRFVAVETAPPYLVRVFELSESLIRQADGTVRDTLRLLAKCRAANHWPGHAARGIGFLDVPPHGLKGIDPCLLRP